MKKPLVMERPVFTDITGSLEAYNQSQEVIAKCRECQGEIIVSIREIRYKKDWNLCDRCAKPGKGPFDLTKGPLPARVPPTATVSFTCESCGKTTMKRVMAYRKTGPFCKACSSKNTFIEKYGTDNPFASEDFQEEKRASIIEKYGSLEEYQRGRQETLRRNLLESEGIENVFQRDGVKAKSRATKAERHDDENFNNRALAKATLKERHGSETWNNRDKARATFLEEHGGATTMECPELKDKVRKTNEERYGGPSPFSAEETRMTSHETKLARYSNENFTNRPRAGATMTVKYGGWFTATPKGKAKVRESFMTKFGVPCSLQAPEVMEKSRKTLLEHFGGHNMRNPTGYETWRQAFKAKYGVDHPSKVPEIRRRVLGLKGMSGPEKKMEEFLKNRGFSYEYSYPLNGKTFDFAVFKGDALRAIIEIDGEYFHGLLSDCDGKHVRGDKDCERFLKVPNGVQFITCDSNRIEDAFAEVTKAFDIDYEEWIAGVIASLPKEFPYPTYDDVRLAKDWKKLQAFTFNKDSRLGASLIRRFHRSIWSARVRGLPSPKEAWNDKRLLEKCVRNRFIYSSSLSSHAIANGFNVCKLAPKVSVFNPALAKHLVERYLMDFNEVFDPFSGFSGRMLGTCALGKRYVGRDLDPEHVEESNEIIEFLNSKADASIDAEISLADVLVSPKETHECLFTCPPYSDKESWGKKTRTASCDEWIDICLEKFSCKTYLFVVDDTKKYADRVVYEIKNRSYLGENTEKVVLIER